MLCCIKLILLFFLEISTVDARYQHQQYEQQVQAAQEKDAQEQAAIQAQAQAVREQVQAAQKQAEMQASNFDFGCQVGTSPQCCWAARIRAYMGQAKLINLISKTHCCEYVGSKNQSSGIPGVYCTADGKITGIYWTLSGLTGPIPPQIEHLVDLESL